MNRIILIGNGFDLAHGLKTGYRDFIGNYWTEFVKKIPENIFGVYEDELTKFEKTSGPSHFYEACIATSYGIGNENGYKYQDAFGRGIIPEFCKALTEIRSYHDLNELIDKVNSTSDLQFKLTFNNVFFEAINQRLTEQKWVDIESAFYSLLKELCPDSSITSKHPSYKTPEELNRDLTTIKAKLIDFLTFIQENEITDGIVNTEIKKLLFEPFNVQDISNGGQEMFSSFLEKRFNMAKNRVLSHCFWYRYSLYNNITPMPDVINYRERNTPRGNEFKIRSSEMAKNVPDFFLLPDDVLFLNFNYTKTAHLYVGKLNAFTINHIHGELGNDKNPIIFGYGDEMDEHYKKIANLNDNEYLQNIKSIRYLETDNYRQLLTFLDSDPYQIYIMGHSCGNSDRTLLNTLFEHPKCVSIKPFYYQKPDGTDDYIDIVQNISRNFKDATLMRDRVVNKTYCEALPQNPQ
ncbi:MAG: bacteriophage abortive infection AbiH family protein [Alistipes sp.]|jgi:hypothetical protein|nr:bacteriophage abortive infection AbiH family protein [Alistipes sp.]